MYKASAAPETQQPDNRMSLYDSLYLKACNIMFNYGSLGAAIASGIACADHDRAIFSEQMQGVRGAIISQGPISGAILPGFDNGALARKLHDHPGFLNGSVDYNLGENSRSQLYRNFFAGLAAYCASRTYQSPSTPGVISTTALSVAATICHLISRKARKKLEIIIAEDSTTTEIQPQLS